MKNPLLSALRFAVSLCGRVCSRASRALEATQASRLVERGEGRDLYETPAGDVFWLAKSSYVDDCIIRDGVFEPACTEIVKRLVRPGQIVIDVGANIGYYSVLFSKIVGGSGRVFAFEPTQHYRSVLLRNLAANKLSNVEILPVGLSDRRQRVGIQVGTSSATIHPPEKLPHEFEEVIDLLSLDEFVESMTLERIDFIKVDVDGHEPLFLDGARRVLDKFNPLILLEVSHLHYLEAGVSAWDFYARLKRDGYRIYDEEGLVELRTRSDFLIKCGNFAYSRNILITKKSLEVL